MYTIKITHEKDQKKWNELVEKLNGSFHHCHENTIFMADITGTKPIFIEFKNSENESVGIASGTLASSIFWPFSKFCKVASFSSTPIVSGESDWETKFLENLENKLKKMGVFRIEFASYDSPNSSWLLSKLNYKINLRYEYVFDLSLNLNELYNKLSSQKRNQIRKANRNKVITIENNTLEGIKFVEMLHAQSMRRRGAGEKHSDINYNVNYWEPLLKKKRINILVSYLGDTAISADLFGHFCGRVYGLKSGTSSIGYKYNAPTHLLWSAIELFKERGYSSLNLGGAKEKEEGLRKFKKELGPFELFQPNGNKTLTFYGEMLFKMKEFFDIRLKKTR